jgi:hypothetical protein
VLLGEDRRKSHRARDALDVPVARPGRDRVDRAVPAEDRGGRLGAPAGQPRIAIGCVADEGQEIGDRRRLDAPLLEHAVPVIGDRPAPVAEDDPIVDDALGHVLVGGADDDLLHRRISPEPGGGRADRVVGLELDHRPEDDAERLDRRLGDRELGEECRIHAGRRLVAREQVVPERLDDPIRGGGDVGRPFFPEQVEELIAQPGHPGQDLAARPEDIRSRGVVGTEELVGRVDEVDLHARPVPQRIRVDQG